MRHCVDLYTPIYEQGINTNIVGFRRTGRNIPSFIQPMDSAEAFYYEQRGLENLHTVYTSDVCTEFQRQDILTWNGKDFHVVGVKNGLFMDVYQELSCSEYPEKAKKLLDVDEYV